MSNKVTTPYPLFSDIDGNPLNAGFLFIGESGKDAENSPIVAYWDEAKTEVVTQPVPTRNGFIVRDNVQAKIYIEEESCSITIKNQFGTLIQKVESFDQISTTKKVKALITEEQTRAQNAENNLALSIGNVQTSLNLQISAEANRATQAEQALDSKINANGVGNRAYKTYAAMDADKANIPAKSKVTVTNDSTASNNGDWNWDGTTFTKSAYDPVSQAAADATTKANTAQANANTYTDNVYKNSVADNILLPARMKFTDTALAGRINKAIRSLSLRGDFTGKLITLAAMSYAAGVFTIQLARPDSETEAMTATGNTKFVARFNGTLTFSGVQKLTLTTMGNAISGEIVIDFGALLQTDALTANYTANERLFDNRAIIDLNAEYSKISGIDTAIVSANDRITRNKGIVFTDDSNAGIALNTRINKAVKSISLRGDINSKLITLSNMSYVGGTFTLGLARPDSLSEVMAGATNTKFVARFNGPITFSGLQTLQLTSYGITSAEISGEIVIDFNELQTTDLLTADYVASSRIFDSRKIIDLNASYTKIKSIDTAISDANTAISANKTGLNSLNLVYGTDFKNAKINDAIEELVFFKPLPKDKYIILKSLYYYTAPVFACDLYVADTPTDQGILWARGEGTIDAANKVVIWFDQGYMTVNLNYYYTNNGANGAAVIQDNATFSTRGLNQALVEQAVLDPKVFSRYDNQYVIPPTFHLPTDIWQRSLKMYLNGPIADTDYYLPVVLFWTQVSGKYRITYQIKKMTSPTQAVSAGLIVYSGNAEFDNLTDIKGTITLKPAPINGQKLEAIIEINLDNLKFRLNDYNSAYTPYFNNSTDFTYEKYGFDVAKLRKTSRDKFCTTSGVIKYPSLKYALDVKERNLFSVGGNTFKSAIEVPLTKDDFLCVNNPPKFLAKKPRKREYDFYYKLAGVTSKIRLDIIDSEDTFYFANKDVIVKAPHPLKQTLTPVTSSSDANFVIYDVSKNAYFSISNFTELFTKTALGVVDINFVRLTYDDELFIIAANPNRTMLITENSQTSLRTFTINGSTGNKYSFGDGVTLVKDWCMAHYKNVMFVCDYDTGVNGIRGTTGGQKCYVSTDNGYTFTKCLDFSGTDWSNVINASAITSYNRDSAHIHAVSYDAKQNVVWVVTGDGATYLDNASFFYSRDLGQTWTQMRSTAVDTNAKTQMIQALPFENCVAFGSDDSSINGMTVITYDGNNMINEIARNVITTQQLLAFARSTWSSNNSRIKYISFGKDVQQIGVAGAKSFVVASSNGYNWQTVWEDANDKIHSNVFCYDDSAGKIFISLDGTAEQVWRVVTLDTKYI